jgi:hypothetical protein
MDDNWKKGDEVLNCIDFMEGNYTAISIRRRSGWLVQKLEIKKGEKINPYFIAVSIPKGIDLGLYNSSPKFYQVVDDSFYIMQLKGMLKAKELGWNMDNFRFVTEEELADFLSGEKG